METIIKFESQEIFPYTNKHYINYINYFKEGTYLSIHAREREGKWKPTYLPPARSFDRYIARSSFNQFIVRYRIFDKSTRTNLIAIERITILYKKEFKASQAPKHASTPSYYSSFTRYFSINHQTLSPHPLAHLKTSSLTYRPHYSFIPHFT